MTPILAVVIGILFAGGIYMVMRRSIVKLIIGLALLGHSANLLIFTINDISRGVPPLIGASEKYLAEPYADPVPQALILTAIVIGFGVQSFAVVLFKRVFSITQTDDIDAIQLTDKE